MRKLFLAAILSVATITLVNAQASFGLHVGGTMANAKFDFDGFSYTTDSKLSWKAGAVATVPLTEMFAFMPQLNVVSKSSQLKEDGDKMTLNLTYAELPLNFVYQNKGFFAGVGPSIAFGVGGKVKVTSDGDTESTKVKFDGKKEDEVTDDNLHLKALDLGGQIIAGYKLPSGVFFNLHYNFGFSNVSPEDSEEGTMKNSYFGFGIGYFFGGGAKASK
jgi:hypothetical protein